MLKPLGLPASWEPDKIGFCDLWIYVGLGVGGYILLVIFGSSLVYTSFH